MHSRIHTYIHKEYLYRAYYPDSKSLYALRSLKKKVFSCRLKVANDRYVGYPTKPTTSSRQSLSILLRIIFAIIFKACHALMLQLFFCRNSLNNIRFNGHFLRHLWLAVVAAWTPPVNYSPRQCTNAQFLQAGCTCPFCRPG